MVVHPHTACPADQRDLRLAAADCRAASDRWGRRPGAWVPVALTVAPHRCLHRFTP
jgi:hypothetical protein